MQATKSEKLIPPDGGWGYAIGFAAILMLIPVSGFRPSFGMMYHDLMEEINIDTTTMGFITGITIMISALSAFMASPILKVLSIRQAAFLAGCLINTGSIAVAFSNSTLTFFLAQTLIQSSGCGLMFNMAYTSIREYFMNKRLLAVSVVQTTISVAVMCTPMIIKYATEYYGHRGMLLIIAAMSMHQFVGASLLQPVAWHMKKVEIQEETVVEMKTLLPDGKSNDIDVKPDVTNGNENLTIDSIEKNKIVDQVLPEPDKKSKLRNFLSHIIDTDLIKEYLFSVTNISLSLANFTTFMYIVMLPRALYAEGKSHNEVAQALSLIGFGDLGMKIIFIFFNNLLKAIECRKLHLVGMAIAFSSRVGYLTINSIAKLAFLPLIGAGSCFVAVLQPLVIADVVPSAKYSGAMGINALSIGIFNLILGPVYGAIRDLTNSYDVIFWIYIATFLGIMILWIIDLKVKKKGQRDSQTA